jgi:two-component system, NtrC family, sensor kinase
MWISRLLNLVAPRAAAAPQELQAESIAISIRWFGLVIGALLANLGKVNDPTPLNLILVLGLVFTSLDTICSMRGRVLLRDVPLVVAMLEAIFITLLCFFHTGLDSTFRFYYLLSLICCAMRYSPQTTFVTCGLDCLGYSTLILVDPESARQIDLYLLTLVVLVWITLAAAALARLLKRTSEQLRENQALLESRIAERTRELEETQAQVLHQEKMAAFGLLAAGIAHEVGNPLTSISNVVQMLQRRELDEYTGDKLNLVTSQLVRIQSTLRELMTFSRPASDVRGSVSIAEVVQEALDIAKYYKGGKNRQLRAVLPEELSKFTGVRDQLVQVVFNLILNAIDATGKGGLIEVTATQHDDKLVVQVRDDGCGLTPEAQAKLFRPYYTTKKHGTGLGLFVIRQIVEAHGGTVRVQSAPGAGATFIVELSTQG